jgi:hypothetical protein
MFGIHVFQASEPYSVPWFQCGFVGAGGAKSLEIILRRQVYRDDDRLALFYDLEFDAREWFCGLKKCFQVSCRLNHGRWLL